jgi:hypothetical protein
MNEEEIRRLVRAQVEQWRSVPFRGQRVEVSEGTVDSLTFMIGKIETDPSPLWGKYQADLTQRQAIGLIPNILNEIVYGWSFPRSSPLQITSWELWHGISEVLDKWCPIPKN